jgi:C-terminal peptidase prc
MPGDRIVHVNDSLIAGVSVENNTVLNLLRGAKNSKVTIGVLRKGYNSELEFEITRDEIPIFSVDVSYMIDEETGFIKISRFAETTYSEFMKGMEKISKAGASKVIIDLRQNTGGALMGVLRMVDEFLEKGEPILYTEGLNQPRKTYNASGKTNGKNIKVYVIIDEFSASASEIFAGAMQDNDRGIVIGRRSFGKGLVQEQIPLMDGSALASPWRVFTLPADVVSKVHTKTEMKITTTTFTPGSTAWSNWWPTASILPIRKKSRPKGAAPVMAEAELCPTFLSRALLPEIQIISMPFTGKV